MANTIEAARPPVDHGRLRRAIGALGAVGATLSAITACATTIPSTDTTSPRVELRVTGPGGGATSNPPLKFWTGEGEYGTQRLKTGFRYRFSLIVTDSGGVSLARMEVDDRIVDVPSVEGSQPVSNEVSGTTRVLEVRGDADDPRTGLTITGRLRVPPLDADDFDPAGLTTTLRARGSDYGGTSGPPNETDLVVEAHFATVDVVTLRPAKTGAERGLIDHDPVGVACGIDRYGLLSPYWARTHGVPVGYDHFWNSSPRRRCEYGVSSTFLGLVKFDLSDLPARPLERAVFKFTEVDVNTESRHPDGTEFCQQIDTEGGPRLADVTALVGPATEEWPEGKRTVPLDEWGPLILGIEHMPVPAGVAVADRSPDKEVEITEIVRRWLDGEQPNHGLALLGQDYHIYQRNKVCAGTAVGFRLELHFRITA